MFRTTVTYAMPKLRSTAIGETRITATNVPMSSAPSAESTVSLIVSQNAARTSYSLSSVLRPSTRPPKVPDLGGGRPSVPDDPRG